ncbi:MAG: superoxide dismutase [Bacteroidales bacterium]
MDKRSFLKTSLATSTGLLIPGNWIKAAVSYQGGTKRKELFAQVPLDYGFDALEPHIDSQTMELHYTKHHAGYTAKLNDAMQEGNHVETDIVKIFKDISNYPLSVRNNGGGYYNHNIYWEVMAPGGEDKPNGDLYMAITRDFGNFERFREEFSSAASGVFGSGWAWLIVNNGDLKITTTPNQDNPLMDLPEIKEKGIPILAIDVWEHAYYLKYQNKRTSYIDAFWNVINWEEVSTKYRNAINM